MMWLVSAFLVWACGYGANHMLAKSRYHQMTSIRIAIPVIFGATILIVWECLVHGFQVPMVILPPPTAIAVKFASSLDILWVDFVQTFVKGALSGYFMGCSSAFLIAIVIDQSVFLKKGLLPVGNFIAALPIVGTAPIFVLWFGFDWQSKAAVVVAMVFFPMLVNTVQGLAATNRMQRDLMATYSASYAQSLLKLRLPAAMPAVFNGLKVSTTLALIGAIVAEFFGSPIKGWVFAFQRKWGSSASIWCGQKLPLQQSPAQPFTALLVP